MREKHDRPMVQATTALIQATIACAPAISTALLISKVFNNDASRTPIVFLISGLMIFVPLTAVGYIYVTEPSFHIIKRKDWSPARLIVVLLLLGSIGGFAFSWLIAFALTGRVVPPAFDDRKVFLHSYLFGSACGLYATLMWAAMNHRRIMR